MSINNKSEQCQSFGSQWYTDVFQLFLDSCNQIKLISQVIRQEILPKLKKYSYLLDIGAGDGSLTKEFAKKFKSVWVIEENMYQIAVLKQKLFKAICFPQKWKEFYEQERPLRKFDLILCSHVLYYVKKEERIRMVKQMLSCVSPGGKLIIVQQSSCGEMYAFFDEFGNQNDHINPADLIRRLRNFYLGNYHISVQIRPRNLPEMFKIALFLLLKPELFVSRKKEIERYLIKYHKVKNGFKMIQEQDILVFRKEG